GREQPTAVAARPLAVLAVDGHAEEAARGRAALEDVAAEAERLQLAGLRRGVPAHPLGEVVAGGLDHEARRPRGSDEADRGPRDGEADFDLGAHRDPLDEWAESLREERVRLVAGAIAERLAEAAGTAGGRGRSCAGAGARLRRQSAP